MPYRTTSTGKKVQVCKVKEVKASTPVRVYDLEVKEVHNYYANGINVHNCTLHEFLEQKGYELGEQLYDLGKHSMRYRYRNLFIAPSGPSKRTLRGATRFSASLDEAGWMKIGKKGGGDAEMMDAPGVHAALKNSLFTVKAAYRRRIEEGYSNIPKPILFMMSSPSAYNDFIMASYRKAHGSKSIYGIKYPTWKFNPTLKKEDFSEEFRSNPVVAERDFACNPPIGVGLFLNDMEVVGRCFSNRKNGLYVQTSLSLSKSKQKVTTAQAVMRTAYRPQNATILSVDVGLVNNSFAIAVIGVPDDFDPETWDYEDSGTQLNPVEVFALGEIMPKGGSRISMHSLYHKVLVPLIDEFNCVMFVSDRWQNASIASSLEAEHEVEPIEWRATWEDFEVTRELLYSGQMKLPKLDSPVQEIMETTLDNYPECFRTHATNHLAWQFATVKEQTNVTVLKGDGGTDDLFRTVVLGATLLQDEETLEELLDYNVEAGQEEKPALGMVRRAGAGKTSTSSSPGKSAIGVITKYKPGT